jgi:hypothetical protein
MMAYGEVDVYIHTFLTSVLVGGEWSASRPGCFTPGERAPVLFFGDRVWLNSPKLNARMMRLHFIHNFEI